MLHSHGLSSSLLLILLLIHAVFFTSTHQTHWEKKQSCPLKLLPSPHSLLSLSCLLAPVHQPAHSDPSAASQECPGAHRGHRNSEIQQGSEAARDCGDGGRAIASALWPLVVYCILFSSPRLAAPL
eukprot:7857683-Pyramimonas_sp.AAC.1